MNILNQTILLIGFVFIGLACSPSNTKKSLHTDQDNWKNKLSPFEYYVLRKKGTERAFSGKYHNHKKKGIYTCKACGNILFSSSSKYDSGTGWPSFFKPLQNTSIKEKPDNSYGWKRTEVLCKKCDSHLGHVFNDGPKPTGLRYCINSICLNFRATD